MEIVDLKWIMQEALWENEEGGQNELAVCKCSSVKFSV